MSRTDVHNPWWVMERDPLWWDHFVERHDHSGGRCDLVQYLASGRTWVRTSCSIASLNRRRNIGCGCRLCTGHAGRQLRRRQERATLRAARRDALKTARADRDGIDIAPPGRVTAW